MYVQTCVLYVPVCTILQDVHMYKVRYAVQCVCVVDPAMNINTIQTLSIQYPPMCTYVHSIILA